MRTESPIERAFVVASAALVVAFTYHHMDLLGDSFWYVAAGDWVLRRGALPDTDPFAFTSLQIPWILHFPAAQVGFAWIVDKSGLGALIVVATLVSAAAQLVFVLPHAKTSAARFVAFAMSLGSIALGADDLSARGQVFGDLGFALLLLLLFRIKDGRRASPLFFFLLSAAWVNFHASFQLCISVTLLFAAASLLDPKQERPPLRPFLLGSAAALVGTGLNPYSYVLVLEIAKLSSAPSTREIDLFRSPDFHSPMWVAFAASAVLVLVVRACDTRLPQRRSEVTILGVLLCATCFARRFGAFLAGYEVVLVARLLSATEVRLPRPALRTAVVLATVLQAAACAALLRIPKDPFAQVPAAATRFIDEHGMPERVGNPYHWGGYLDFVFRGRRKVFIDGRVNLFENGAFDDAYTIERAAPGFLDLLDTYEISTLLVERNGPLDRALQRALDWRPVFEERLARVYERRQR